MSKPKQSGLEFEKPAGSNGGPKSAKEEAGGSGTRHAFRLPLAAAENVKVKLNNRAYEVVDICRDGVGLRIGKDVSFPVAGEKVKLSVTLEGTAHEVSGRIIHISPDFSDRYLCGIQFIDLKAAFKKTLTSFLSQRRMEWFSDQPLEESAP